MNANSQISQIAITLAGEMIHLSLEENSLSVLAHEEEVNPNAETSEDLAAQEKMVNALKDSTAALIASYLLIPSTVNPEPVALYKWALHTFEHDDASEEEQRASVSLLLSAKEDLAASHEEVADLPAVSVPLYEVPPSTPEEKRHRDLGKKIFASPLHGAKRLVSSVKHAGRGAERKVKGAFAKVGDKAHQVVSNIEDRPHYRVRIVKTDD